MSVEVSKMLKCAVKYRGDVKYTGLKIKTGSSKSCSEMKSLAAILVGPIQYIEIPLRTAFCIDDCWNVMNALQETE